MDATNALRRPTNPLSSIGFRLITLGTVTLTDRHGVCEPTLAKRRRKLAVLAVLALARRPVRRDRLAEMFWGDEDDARARHSLADSLSNLRRVLGPDSVATRQLEIVLSPTCPLTVDALDLIEAAERRDHARVIELYGGPFLDGMADTGSAALGRWVEGIRAELHRYWTEACAYQCLALARSRRWGVCAAIARRWFDAEPMSSDAALYLLNAIKASATTEAYAAALDEYSHMEARLERECNRALAPEVARLAASIREELAARREDVVRRAAVDVAPPATVGQRSDVPEARASSPRRRRFAASRVASLGLVVLLFVTATSFTTQREELPAPAGAFARPVVAVLDIRNIDGDSASDWLEVSVPPLIASQVARAPGVDVVAPDFVREARSAMGLDGGRVLSRQALVRVGRRVGAHWVATGGITRSANIYVLDVTVHDVFGDTTPRQFRVADASLVTLAELAAARLSSIASTSSR